MANKQRGLTSSQEQDPSKLIRDVRPLATKIYEFYKSPEKVAILMLVVGIAGILVGVIAQLVMLFILVSFFYTLNQRSILPFRLPQRAKVIDYNDATPTGGTRLSRGIYLFGNEKSTSEELWFANDDMRTHALIFGSTGAGKTETLLSIAYNALVQSSGFIYVDGKGDNGLFAKIFSMMKSMGREDDLLLINFMTGARDIIGAQDNRQSNTLNPFSSGSSGMLSNLVASMMDSGGSGGDGDMWKGRAIAFVEALFKILVYERDAGNVLLDADTIRNYFSLDRLEAMVADKVFIRDGQFDINLEDVPEVILQPITNYLLSLPGYVKERKGKQVSQVLEQHGYITMQLTRTFSTFADTYGHIMRVNLAEVDLKDIVLNRRVLATLLPALEKSPDELANLGKIVIASMRAMMATGLGDNVEGTYQDVILTKPTNATTPFLCVLDEYGYYAVKGFAVVPAQARSLGFSCIFAGQDLPAFQKASKEEAASIGANTNIKICMKLEDPTDTWEFFMKGAGESYVTSVESFSAQSPGLTGSYSDTKTAKADKRSRIDLLDLKEQVEGEAHIFFKSKIVRARMFYAGPPATKAMRLNVFLRVDLPKDEDLYTLVKSIEDFEAMVKNSSYPVMQAEKDEDIEILQLALQKQSKIKMPIENGLNALFELHKVTENAALAKNNSAEAAQQGRGEAKPIGEGASTEGLDAASVGNMSIDVFSPASIDAQLRACIPVGMSEQAAQPAIEEKMVNRVAVYLEKLLGNGAQKSDAAAQNLVEDMHANTRYSRESLQSTVSTAQLVKNVAALCEALQ